MEILHQDGAAIARCETILIVADRNAISGGNRIVFGHN